MLLFPKTYLIIIFSIFFAFCFSQSNDLTRLNIYGSVKSITESSYLPSPNAEGVIEKGSLELYYINNFNESGNKTEDDRFNSEGKLDKKYIYKLDKTGK